MFVLFQPVWLLLLIPLAAAWFTWLLPNRGLKILRAMIFLLVVLALAQLAVKLPDRAGTVIVVADRSASMPQNSDASEKEIIGLATNLASLRSDAMPSSNNRRNAPSSPGSRRKLAWIIPV
jgi:hypothetical protein